MCEMTFVAYLNQRIQNWFPAKSSFTSEYQRKYWQFQKQQKNVTQKSEIVVDCKRTT